jgi:hypothetical protein
MSSQVNLDGIAPVTQTPPVPVVTTPRPPIARTDAPAPATPHELTFAERQGLAMGWVAMALGVFVLLGGLALWAAVALDAGFSGWLIGMGVMGVVMVAVVVIVGYFMRQPRR